MPATVLEKHYQDRVQSVRQMALPENGHSAPSGQEFEDLVALCVDLCVTGRQLLQTAFKRIFRKHNLTVAWLQERRQAIEELSGSALDLVTSVRKMVGPALQAPGSPLEQDTISRLEEAIRIIAEARQRTLERWPVFSAQEMAEARANSTEEDYVDAEEAFAQIAGVDLDTWRQRLEKHRQLLQH
jgi:hypothetical protein